MPESNEQTIAIDQGRISRLYVVMCNRCFLTFTSSVQAIAIMQKDIEKAGWKLVDGKWLCPDCKEK